MVSPMDLESSQQPSVKYPSKLAGVGFVACNHESKWPISSELFPLLPASQVEEMLGLTLVSSYIINPGKKQLGEGLDTAHPQQYPLY